MKKLRILSIGVLFLYLAGASFCYADKVYCKDGRVVYGTILCRTKGSVWVKHDAGAVGVSLDSVEKIESDDGTVSLYDYGFFYNIVRDSIAQKKYGDAMNMCNMLLKNFPENTKIRYLRAVISHKTGNIDQAMQDYDFLIQNKFADADILNNRGVIYAESEEYEKAGDLFLKAVKLDEKNVEIRNNLAEALMQIKDYKAAIKEYDKIMELDAGNIAAAYNSGVAHMKDNDYDKARELWNKIIAINPDNADAKSAIEHLNAAINGK